MGASVLPYELIQHIFRHLSAADVLECRKVCLRWEHAADGLSEDFWKNACMEDYNEVYKEAYRKATLSWGQLYKSLSLWPKVSTANFRVYKLPADVTGEFVLLRDGIIGCPHKNRPQDRCDKIIYYDLATCQEHNRISYDTPFHSYTENDNMILVKPLNRYIVVTIKSTNMRVSIKKHADKGFKWTLFDNEFYYQTLGKLYRVKLVQENDDVNLETIKISAGLENPSYFREEVFNIEEIAYTNSGELHLRANSWIFTIINNELRETNYFETAHIPLNILKSYNFRWNTADISAHLRKEEGANSSDRRSPFLGDIIAACIYNKIVIIATHVPRRMLYIFYNPYNRDGELKLCNAVPDKSFDLDAHEIGDKQQMYPAVRQIEVAETVNGHNILVLCCGIVHVIELKHDANKTGPSSVQTAGNLNPTQIRTDQGPSKQQSKRKRSSAHFSKCKKT